MCFVDLFTATASRSDVDANSEFSSNSYCESASLFPEVSGALKKSMYKFQVYVDLADALHIHIYNQLFINSKIALGLHYNQFCCPHRNIQLP